MMLFLVILSASLLCKAKWSLIEVEDNNGVDNNEEVLEVQSGRKCVSVAAALRADQGPCEPIKGCIREIREQ